MSERKIGMMYGLAGGVIFGILPILVLSFTRGSEVSNSFLTMSRMMLSAVCFSPYVLYRIRKLHKTPPSLKLCVMGGMFIALTNILVYNAYNTVPSGIVITLHYLYPVAALLIAALVLRRRP